MNGEKQTHTHSERGSGSGDDQAYANTQKRIVPSGESRGGAVSTPESHIGRQFFALASLIKY